MQAIHGVDDRIGRDGKAGHASIWCDIIKEMDRLATQRIDLVSMMQIKIGNGSNTSFWEDRWRGEKSLKEEYPRLYALEPDITAPGVEILAAFSPLAPPSGISSDNRLVKESSGEMKPKVEEMFTKYLQKGPLVFFIRAPFQMIQVAMEREKRYIQL
nr:RNA-directed DNA polymerase, eukaryota, reverse transcriptase zinc-binding domain protein [Tanacetum cinerariifolium]